MSLEQAVVQLEQTNAALQEEVVRFRDAAMGLNNTWPTTTEGRQNTADGKYFSVPGNGTYMRLYRRTGSSAELIAEYPSRESMVEAINEATADAEARANVAADRAEVYADNKGFVTLERLRKQATLDLDFGAGDYSVDEGDKLRTTNATDLLSVDRATPKWVFGPNGKLREVPPNTLARQWNPATGEPEGVLIEEQRTNLLPWSDDLTQWNTRDADVLPFQEPAPDGGSAYWIREGTGGEAQYIQSEALDFPVGPSLLQVYMRANGARYGWLGLGGSIRVFVDLEQGVISNSSSSVSNAHITPLPYGWYRVSCLYDSDGVTSQFRFGISQDGESSSSFPGDGVSGIAFWGAQLEAASAPSSYIPTEGAPATRAADSVSRELGEEFNPSEFTWFVDIILREDHNSGATTILSGNTTGGEPASSSSNRLLYLYGSGSMRTFDGGDSASAILGDDYFSEGRRIKAAISLKGADLIIAANGEVASGVHSGKFLQHETSELVPISWKGCDFLDIKGIPRALSEAELQELTAL